MSTQSSYRSQIPASACTVTKGDSNELLIDDVAQIDGLRIRTSGEMGVTSSRGRVVVVGGGFGGLQAVKALARADVDVTLIDRNNYHLFQPLSYQVATGALSPGEIAVPLRQIFRREPRVRVVMGEVTGFDLKQREVLVGSAVGGISPQRVSYDALLVAGGSSYCYFGREHWRSLALEVKSLDSSLRVRGRILQAFEAAELEHDPQLQAGWLTFVVVGAGPTGVEIAGQIAELARDTLPAEFRESDPRAGRVLLVETSDRVLSMLPPSLSRRARRSLEELGVTALLSHTVVDVQADSVEIQAENGSRTRIPTRTVVWAAGVEASPLARSLGEAGDAEIDRAGRLIVEPDLTLPGHPEVLAFGDMVRVRDSETGQLQALPGIAPVAMQQGRYAGRLLTNRLAGRATPPFRYRNRGTLATIGRARAVADIHGLRVSGRLAWFIWLVVHLGYLVGFENRMLVLLRWTYSFITHGRGTRLITNAAGARPTQDFLAHQDTAPPRLQSAH
jgi:NADH:ubiquinone reductase (H+-translocating)